MGLLFVLMYDFIEKFAYPSIEFQNDIIEITEELKAVYKQQIVDSFIEQCYNNDISKTDIFKTFLSVVNDTNKLTNIPSHIMSLLRKNLKEQNYSLGLGAIASCLIHLQSFTNCRIEWEVESGEGMDVYMGSNYFEKVFKIIATADKVTIYNSASEIEREYHSDNLSKQAINKSGIILLTNYSSSLLFEGNKQLNRNNELNEIQSKFEIALRILKENAELYFQWITSVVEVVAIVEGNSNFIYSGSDINYPGIINVSYPSTSVAIAEMLVHESSHQYWFMCQWFEDIVNGNDAGLYYSPIKKCDRPLWAIHTAYHAFSNVALFYDSCIKGQVQDDGYCNKNILPLLDQMKVLQKTLEATDGLTKTGELLWKPLADKLNSF